MAFINFGSRVLELGMSGTDVEILQFLLNNLPFSSPVTIDSKFGSMTEVAVKKFQAYFGLSADDIVGKNTFLFLGQQTGPYLPSGAPVFGSRTLSKGSSGRDVWVLQNRLASTAKKYALALGGPADSQFGPKTQAAVKLFQKDNGLAQDGIVGPDTFMQLYRKTQMGGRYLQRNKFERNQGYDVYFLQVHLKSLGFNPGELDGKFGPATQMAVKSLQRSVAITPDGVVGPDTYYHLAAT
ncbi:MAG TPA: peptidoglycan-binding protein [Syntrophomonadaceae bacterium]|nr:peptidoglycan-binding protein [Syntrophomonadaceae bacterium]